MTTSMVAAAVAALVACGGGSHGKSSGLSLSVVSTASSARSTPAGISVSGGVTISRIRMAVRRISVEGGDTSGMCDPSALGSTTPVAMSQGGGSGGPGSDDNRKDDGAQVSDDGGCEFAFGPFDVDLAGSALSGGQVDFAFDAPIPAGTYHEVSITVKPVPASRAGDDQVLKDLAAANASILVDGFIEQAGTTTTRAFSFASPLVVKQKREGAIVIGPSSNVTLDFDPSNWFAAGTSQLDPTDPANQAAITDNIRASLKLVHDDDHDGQDDDSEHGAGHR